MADDLIEALLSKLEPVSQAWTTTFASAPSINVKGYTRLQKILNAYGYETVRRALEYAYEKRISPQGPSAMPLLIGLCKAMKKGTP